MVSALGLTCFHAHSSLLAVPTFFPDVIHIILRLGQYSLSTASVGRTSTELSLIIFSSFVDDSC